MQNVGSRTYSLARSEFPLRVDVTADGLPVNRAVVGHLRMIKDLAVTQTVDAEPELDSTGMTLTFDIKLPNPPQPYEPPPFDITCNIQGFFDDGAGEDTRYLIVIKNRLNQQGSTELFVPTINPASATLRFLVR
jgi:hypothetical protein